MINFIAALGKSSVGLLLKISQCKHLSSEPEFEAVTTYEGISRLLKLSKCSQGEISSPNLKIAPTKIGYHQKMNEKYPQTGNLSWLKCNVMTFTIKQQLIDNSIMIITRNDCHVSQLISCWLFNNLFHNRSFYLF